MSAAKEDTLGRLKMARKNFVQNAIASGYPNDRIERSRPV
jgi:hypothetical protein